MHHAHVGKLLLVSMALYVVRQLVYMRLDRMQARAEEEQQKALELSLRRAREEAQRKLQILGACKQALSCLAQFA